MGDSGSAPGYAAFVAVWDTRDLPARFIDRTVTLVATLGTPALIGSLPWAVLAAWAGYRWSLAIVRRRRGMLARWSVQPGA